MPISNPPSFDSPSRTTLGSPALTGPQQQPVGESSRGSKLRETVQPGVPTHARRQHAPAQSTDLLLITGAGKSGRKFFREMGGILSSDSSDVSSAGAGESGGTRTVAACATTPGQDGRRAGAAGVEQRLRREIQQRQAETVRLLRKAATQPKAPEVKGWRAILKRLCGGPRPVKPADIAASLVRVNDSLLEYNRRCGGGDDTLRLGAWTDTLVEELSVPKRLAVIDLLQDDEFQRALAPSLRPPRRADGDGTCTPLGEAHTLVAAAQAALPSCHEEIKGAATLAAILAMELNEPECLDRMLRAAATQLAPLEGRLSAEGRRQMVLDAVLGALTEHEAARANLLLSGSLRLLHELHARAQAIGASDEATGRAIVEKRELIKLDLGQHADTIATALQAWQEQALNVASPICRDAASRLRDAIQQYATFTALQGLDAGSDFAGIQRCEALIAEAQKAANQGLGQLFESDTSSALGAAAQEVRQALLLPDKTAADLLQALAAFDREVEKHQALAALANCPMGELRAALIEDLVSDVENELGAQGLLERQLDSKGIADLQRQLEDAAGFCLHNDQLEAHAQACRLVGHLELLRGYAAGDPQTVAGKPTDPDDPDAPRPINQVDEPLAEKRMQLAQELREDPAAPGASPGRGDPEQAQQTQRAIEDLLQLNLPSERPAARGTQGRYDDDMMAVYTRAVIRPFSSISSEAGKVDLGDGLKPSDSFMHEARRGFSMYFLDDEPVFDHQGWDALDERQRDERIHAGLRKLVAFYGDVDKVNALIASLGQAQLDALIEPWTSHPVTLPDGRQVIPFTLELGSDPDPAWGERRSGHAGLGKTPDGIPYFVLQRTLNGGRAVEVRDGVPICEVNLDPSSWQRITCALQLSADLSHAEPMPGAERPHYELDLQVSNYQKLEYPPPSWEVLVASIATNEALRNDLERVADLPGLQAEAQAFTAIRQFAAYPCGATAAPVLAAIDKLPGKTAYFGVDSQWAQDARDRVEAALRDDAQSPMDAHLFDPLQEHLKPDIELLAHQLRSDIEARRIT